MTSKKMGRPVIYQDPRRPRTVTLSDRLWEALGIVAGEGKRVEYIENRLREVPEIAAILDRQEPRE